LLRIKRKNVQNDEEIMHLMLSHDIYGGLVMGWVGRMPELDRFVTGIPIASVEVGPVINE
jgi:hypothetical protein